MTTQIKTLPRKAQCCLMGLVTGPMPAASPVPMSWKGGRKKCFSKEALEEMRDGCPQLTLSLSPTLMSQGHTVEKR